MIKTFELYKESILNKLEGPSKEEIWKNFGYDQVFDRPEDFFNYLKNNSNVVEEKGGDRWYDENGRGIMREDKMNNLLVINKKDYEIFLRIFFFEERNVMEDYFRKKIFPANKNAWNKLHWVTYGNID